MDGRKERREEEGSDRTGGWRRAGREKRRRGEKGIGRTGRKEGTAPMGSGSAPAARPSSTSENLSSDPHPELLLLEE